MTESLAQKLFEALSKNKSMYLNDYEVARLSGLHENELEQARIDLEEILVGSDTSIVIDGKGAKDRRWKIVVRRQASKKEKKEQVSLF